MPDLPPIPEGFTLEQPPSTVLPPTPAGFTIEGPDKYQQAAIDERNRLQAAGAHVPGMGGYQDYSDRAMMGLPWSDEIMAGLSTPFEMVKHGVGPSEAYNYAKARENLNQAAIRQSTAGVGGALAELAGGVGSMGGAFSGARTAAAPVVQGARTFGQKALEYGTNVAKSAGIGGLYGAGEGDSFEDRFKHAMIGTALGGTLGAAAPLVAPTVSQVARVIQLPRLRDPAKVATEQMSEVLANAGMEPAQVVADVASGRAAGQPYNVADALGKEGQRKLAAMAKTPGEQRDLIATALTARNLNMPNRVGEQVGDALGVQGTAEQAHEALVNQAAAQSQPLYREAERYAREVAPTWSDRLQNEFLNDPIVGQGLRQGREIQRLRGNPNATDAAVTGFDEAFNPIVDQVPNMYTLHTIKTGLDAMIAGEANPVTGRLTARGAAINDFKNRMLAEIDRLNPAYAAARDAYGGPMQVNDALRYGQTMPTAGRAADTIRQVNAMPPTAQQGVRIGYADTVQKQLERTGNYPSILREKSQKGANELDALSLFQGPSQPGAPSQLRQRLNREETMLQTARDTLGGSSTAENLADMATTPGAMNVLGAATSAARGDAIGTLNHVWQIAKQAGKGESAAQRLAITKALMETDPNAVQAMANRITQYRARQAGYNPFNRAQRLYVSPNQGSSNAP